MDDLSSTHAYLRCKMARHYRILFDPWQRIACLVPPLLSGGERDLEFMDASTKYKKFSTRWMYFINDLNIAYEALCASHVFSC